MIKQNIFYQKKNLFTHLSIQNTFSNRKNFSILSLLDACLMAMIEVKKIVAPFVDFMVASQEAELGLDELYTCFCTFSKRHYFSKLLGIHLVNAYAKLTQQQ